MKRIFAAAPWLLLLAFPALEVGAHAWTRARVAPLADFRAAAAFVRARLQPRDLIASAPDWTDPVLRQVLGDRIDLAMAGRSDTAGYERLWALSIRGARPREAPNARPSFEQRFGTVTLARWELGASPVLYQFVKHLAGAAVALVEPDRLRPCRRRHFAPPLGGGLGTGMLPPADRVTCEPGPHSPWVAQTVIEDLSLRPRYCILQPVAGREPLRVTFADVPLGDRLVFYGGLYYEDERMRNGAPISARILIGDQPAASLRHLDGDGWKRLVIGTPGGRARADVAVEVSASQTARRRFCWDASTRGAGARAEP